MIRSSTLLVLCLSLSCAFAPAQQEEPQRRSGTLFKHEVDGLVRGLRELARGRDGGGLGAGTVRDTARALTAMAHCHRFYSAADGPVVRPHIQFLFSQRRADGSFADEGEEGGAARATTGWVMEALRGMDPKAYADEIAFLSDWLVEQGAPDGWSPWREKVNGVLALAEHGTWPQQAGAPIAGPLHRGLPMKDGAPHGSAMVDALVELVACQKVNRLLDEREQDEPDTFPASMQQGIDYLLGQQEDGVFMVTTPAGRFPDPGLTALALAALQTKPAALRTGAEQDTIDRATDWLLEQQNEDGSFGRQTVNYVTCCTVMAFEDQSHRPEIRKALDRAQKYLLAIQNVEHNSYEESDRDYGSIGYGGDQRGDLSNTQMALEALRATGLSEQHEAFQKALAFLQRTQNLKKYNDYEGVQVIGDGERVKVVPGDDGGSAYYPGNSPAGYIELPDGSRIPRSYGSMTYALLKSYTMAGIDPDDPRVRAAVDWIEKNWTVDVNPGADPDLGEKAQYQGLFYYYMVMAQALEAVGIDTVETKGPDGGVRRVDWRADLARKLEKLQKPTGSWVNERNDRWYEGYGLVCTSYALLALEICRE